MAHDPDHRGPVNHTAAGLVVLAMVITALSMWTVVPYVWLWIASQISKTQAPEMGPYMIVLLGVIVSIVILGWILVRLSNVYSQLTGSHAMAAFRPAWLKSMRDEPDHQKGASVIEAVIVISVILAVIVMGLWFFILAGSPLPNP
jgi:hypothetical protein